MHHFRYCVYTVLQICISVTVSCLVNTSVVLLLCQQPTTKRTPTASVRLKKKIAPTVVSVRPRRPKQDSTHHNKPDGQLVATPHVNSGISPTTDVMSSHCSSTRTLPATEPIDLPVTHTPEQRNDVSHVLLCVSRHVCGTF